MKRTIWIVSLILSIALALSACKGGEDTAAQPSAPEEDTAAAPAEAPAESAPAAVEELPPDSPGAIFQAAMAGVETDVKPFFDGIPVPEKGSISMSDDNRLDFVTSLTLEEGAQFYRDTFTALGLIEIEELTTQTDFNITMVFGGYPGGKAIKVTVKRLSNVSRNIQVSIVDPSDL